MERTGRGRQAEARRNDAAVLEAARLVFAVHGPDAPVSAVAAEAGVGVGSLYRRYPSKEELLRQLCLASLNQQIAIGQAAVARQDVPGAGLGAGLEEYIRTCVARRVGVLTSLAGTIVVTPDLQDAARQAHDLLGRLVVEAQRAGVLRSDVSSVDIHQLIELFSRRRVEDREPGTGYQRLLEVALEGLRGPGIARSTCLPGMPASWASYVKAWSRTSMKPPDAVS